MKITKFLLLFSLIYLSLSSFVPSLATPFDTKKWQEVFDHSQYCVPQCEFRGNIDDPELYTLAGYHYLQGADPSSINEETQPLTKYTFGLSTLLFGNALPAQLLYAVLTLWILYLLSSQLLSPLAALIPPLLLVTDPLFLDQLSRPFLDLSLTFWLLLFVYYLSLGKYAKYALWGGVVLGCLALAKSFSYGVLSLMLGFVYVYLQTHRLPLSLMLKLGGFAGLTYVIGYTMFFLHGHSPVDFLALHYDTLRLYRGYVPEYPKGEIFRLIFSGDWRIWWGEGGTIPSPFYSLAWPIALLSSIWVGITKARMHKLLALHVLLVAILLFFISTRLMFPRYLLPLLPSMYLLLAYSLGFAKVKS